MRKWLLNIRVDYPYNWDQCKALGAHQITAYSTPDAKRRAIQAAQTYDEIGPHIEPDKQWLNIEDKNYLKFEAGRGESKGEQTFRYYRLRLTRLCPPDLNELLIKDLVEQTLQYTQMIPTPHEKYLYLHTLHPEYIGCGETEHYTPAGNMLERFRLCTLAEGLNIENELNNDDLRRKINEELNDDQ